MPAGPQQPVTGATHPLEPGAYACPSCGHALERRAEAHGVTWVCPGCGGRAVGLGLLKQVRDPALVTHAWLAAESAAPGHGRPCPMCGGAMRSVTGDSLPKLDICTLCEVVWFDPKAYEAFPVGGAPAAVPVTDYQAVPVAALPEEARVVLATEQSKTIAEHYRQQMGDDPPDAWWKWVAAFFGMPVRDGEEQLDRPPWATWGLVAFTSTFSLLTFTNLHFWINAFGFIPAEAQRYWGLTFLTSFFLHAGIFHLVGNMYFLLLFGDNVEETIGIGRYFLLLFLATTAGAAIHGSFDPHRTVPLVGASGGIAGVMAFYACQFPNVRLKFLFGSLWLGLYRWYTLPTWGFFAFWIVMQGAGAMAQISGFSSVSSLGHLGGAAVGGLFYLEWRFFGQYASRPESAGAPVPSPTATTRP